MSAAKAIVITGVLGSAVGIGYAIVRHRRANDAEAESTDAASTDEAIADETDKPALFAPAGVPLAEPDHPRLHTRINRSTVSRGVVQEGAMQLLEQAAKYHREIDLDELTGARLAASELSSGTFTELACIIDAEQNRAERKGKSLFASLTDRSQFGKQGGKRPASTRRDPRIRELLAAREVIRGSARGISRGATRFYDPETLDVQHKRYRAWVASGRKGKKPAIVSCDALTLLEAWSFDYGKKGKSRCPPDRSRPGRHSLAWVGPIAGVDPLRLLLMKPMAIGDQHTRHYQAARAMLARRLGEER